MKVNTANWPDICSVVIDSSRMIIRLRPSSAHVLSSTGVPISPPRQPPCQQQRAETPDHADAAIHRAPAIAAGDEGDQRQADRSGERPAEKDVGNGAAALFRRHHQVGGAGGLRRVERTDRQHDQADDEQRCIIRRKRRCQVGEREHRERGGQQGAAFDPAGQPAVNGEPMHSTTAPKVISNAAPLIVTSRPDDNSPSIPAGASTEHAGDDVSEHQGGGRETDVRCGHFSCKCIYTRPLPKERARRIFRRRSPALAAAPVDLPELPDCAARIPCYTAAFPLTCARSQE